MLTLLFSLLLTISPMQTANARLSVKLTNVTNAKGTIRMALYNPGAKFGETTPAFTRTVAVRKAGNQTVEFEVPPGRYAVAMYHDVNDNDKIDKNFVGYPKEPFGFSNNFRPRFSAPDFEDCAFDLGANGTSINIRLLD